MNKKEKSAKSEWDSLWEAYNEPHELSRAEWGFVLIIFAIIIGKTLITAMGAI